jgi:hypothetical protein
METEDGTQSADAASLQPRTPTSHSSLLQDETRADQTSNEGNSEPPNKNGHGDSSAGDKMQENLQRYVRLRIELERLSADAGVDTFMARYREIDDQINELAPHVLGDLRKIQAAVAWMCKAGWHIEDIPQERFEEGVNGILAWVVGSMRVKSVTVNSPDLHFGLHIDKRVRDILTKTIGQ